MPNNYFYKNTQYSVTILAWMQIQYSILALKSLELFHCWIFPMLLPFLKDYFRLKCILSYYVPVQTIVSPYDANCVTPLIYPTTDLDFLFGIIVSFDLSFYFFYFFETCTQPFFCKRHYPVIVMVITITRHVLYTGKCTRLYILEIIKAWPLCILWTRGHAYLLTQLYKIKKFG